MNATIWVFRHGQSQWNAEGRLQGQQDIPLTAEGTREAHRLSERLRSAGTAFAAVYTSDLRRTRDTAAIVAQALGVPLRIHPALRERGAGRLEGLRWPELARVIGREPPPPGEGILDLGETSGVEAMADVRRRAVRSLRHIAEVFPGQHVVLIGHGTWMTALLHSISQGHEDVPWIGNGTGFRVSVQGHRLSLSDVDRRADGAYPSD